MGWACFPIRENALQPIDGHNRFSDASVTGKRQLLW
jgi:hypothetical protein